jgi:O-antigen/teichoic acid export membrane protein
MGLALGKQPLPDLGFARHAMTLGGGNALAQLIVLGLSPVIAHLYSPEAFGLFAAYTAILHLLAVAATGQYETALMLPRRDRQAACLLIFILMLCPTLALGFGLVLIVLSDEIASLMGAPRLAIWFWAMPVSIVLAGWYQSLRFWTIRREAFADVARNAVTRTTAGTGLACVMGIWQPFPGAPEGGLILSHILGEGFGNLLLASRARRRDRALFAWPGWTRLLAMARRWRRLALTYAAGQGVARCYSRLPVLAISWLFGPSAAGLYAWAERFADLPGLVATSIGDVYRQRATVEYHRHGRFDGLMRRTLTATTLLALAPYALGIALAPVLFAWLFGQEWRDAGVLAQVLMVGGFVSFAITPVDKAAVIFQRTRYIFLWHVARLTLKLGAVIATAMLGLSLMMLLWLIVAVRVGLYLVELVYNYRLAKGERS